MAGKLTPYKQLGGKLDFNKCITVVKYRCLENDWSRFTDLIIRIKRENTRINENLCIPHVIEAEATNILNHLLMGMDKRKMKSLTLYAIIYGSPLSMEVILNKLGIKYDDFLMISTPYPCFKT